MIAVAMLHGQEQHAHQRDVAVQPRPTVNRGQRSLTPRPGADDAEHQDSP